VSEAPQEHALIARDAVAEGEARAVELRVGERVWSFIIARQDGLVRAYHNVCPHAGMPLDRPDGRVTLDLLGYIVCAAHLASFRVADGGYAGGPKGPGGRGLRAAPIRIADGVIYVQATALI
jgi:nitrite reductase/ring-hydroxylating ferredoxin subunit